jgi:hypothetical protein
MNVREGDLLTELRRPPKLITGAAEAEPGRLNICSGTSADYTVTLPPAARWLNKFIALRMAPLASLSKLVTIDGNGSETIDGDLTRIMWADESAVLISDGTNIQKIGGRSLPMYAGMIHASGAQAISSSVSTKVNINASVTNNTGIMVDTTNKRINIKRKSSYQCTGFAVVCGTSNGALSANATRVLSVIYASVNGAAVAQVAAVEGYGPLGGFPTYQSTVLLSLFAADFVELWCHHSSPNTEAVWVGNPGGSQISVIEIPQW